MEITQILPDLYRYKDCKCSECTFRFGCWTSQSTCCPLKAVRITVEPFGDDHLFMRTHQARVEINDNLGKFDNSLLAKIGELLLEDWHESKQKS